ncbi:transposable element Tcb2 transposase [Trichonephila clavipes]|nr:transposable element Tcb2 transposase [Trichonephila clavipes]
MSPIEHVWDIVGRHLARDLSPAASTDELWLRIQTIWNTLPQADIQNLFNSMPRRVAALIAARVAVVVSFPKGRNERCGLLYDRWRHNISLPPQFRHGTGGEGNILQPPALVVSAAIAQKTFGPTDLASTYSVCTRRIFVGIGHLTQTSRSGA